MKKGMKQINYKRKRQAKHITFYTMCKELGINKNIYKEIEEGVKSLEGEYLEKFNETIRNAKTILMERKIKMIDVNRWYEENDLKEKSKEMGYSLKQLSKTIDLSYPTIARLANNIKYCGEDVKEEVYDFLNNSLNKKVKKVEEDNKKTLVSTKIEEPIETVEAKDECVYDGTVFAKSYKAIPERYLELSITNRKDKEIQELELEIEKLKRQIYLYEKLIERL